VDTYDENDEFDTETETVVEDPKPKRNWRRDLEEQASAAKQAKAEAAAAQRELALLKAGIDLDSPQGKLFAKGYDGAADVAAIKAAAVEYGVIESDAPSVPQEELAAHDRLSQAAAVSTTSGDEGSQAVAEVAAAKSMEELRAALAKYGIETEYEQPLGWTRSDSTVPM
jgi:hypothetical protein